MIGVKISGRPRAIMRCWLEALRPVMIRPATIEVPM